MAVRNSPSSYKLQSLVTLLYQHRGISGVGHWRSHLRDQTPYKLGHGCCADQGLRFLSTTSRSRTLIAESNSQMAKDQNGGVQVQVQPPSPAPSNFGFSNWVKWLLGSVVTLLLPFWENKWDKLLTLEGRAEKVVKEVEVVAEVVEKVAATADKALTEVANQLPDNSKLKKAAQALEHVSAVAAQDAQLVDNIIHKVGDVKQDLEDLETMVEPIIDRISKAECSKD